MSEPFIDCTTLHGQRRIRSYVLGWLERLDYAGRLDRCWPEAELALRIWDRVEREYAVAWKGPVVENRPLARVIACTMVEDYYRAYPERRICRYSVAGVLPDVTFRRCVLDFIHDIEEFEAAALPVEPRAAADVFWAAVRATPERWGCRGDRGPFVDDEPRAWSVALEVIEEYFDLQSRLAARAAEPQPRIASD